MSETIAEQCIAKMLEHDQCTKKMGIKIITINNHEVITTMKVRQDMLNGFHTCHGGQIFTLADSTFAFACNTNNQVTVASGCDIHYLLPAYLDDRLTAVAKRLSHNNRLGLYEVTITNQDDKVITLFHGRAYTITGKTIL